LAVTGDRTDVAHMLLARGANVNAATEYGSTPLHWAVEKGCADAVRLLIQNGADIHAMNESHEIPLHRAAARGYTNIVAMLKSAGLG
jgi:ankyrin repeat protein